MNEQDVDPVAVYRHETGNVLVSAVALSGSHVSEDPSQSQGVYVTVMVTEPGWRVYTSPARVAFLKATWNDWFWFPVPFG